MGITIQIDDATVTKIAGAIRTNIPHVARTNEAMILANPELSERLPKLAALLMMNWFVVTCRSF